MPQCMLGYHTPRTRQPPPRADSPREQTPPPQKHAPAYGQWAAGMHPTGMHSCDQWWKFHIHIHGKGPFRPSEGEKDQRKIITIKKHFRFRVCLLWRPQSGPKVSQWLFYNKHTCLHKHTCVLTQTHMHVHRHTYIHTQTRSHSTWYVKKRTI